jgi:hypothetical protein
MTDITETVLDPRQAPTQHVVALQTLHGAPRRVAEILARLPAEAQAWQPTPEAWSAHMLAAHLAAGEAPFRQRLQRIVDEDNPWLPYFGPDVARPDTPGSLDTLLAQFRAEREALVRWLVALTPADWERPAVHETMGPTTLALQVHNIASHDADHLEQLSEAGRAWEKISHA